MRKKTLLKYFFTLTMLGIVLSPLFAEQVVGEIVYIEGRVDVFRDGRQLGRGRVDIGSFIEEYDMVETGEDGYVEIVLSNSSSGSEVRVLPGTSFYFDLDDVEGPKKTEFAMMTGSMAFRVKKLSGNEEYRVRTESVAMGVRGTNFQVTVAPEGSVLTVCDEGAVECTTEEGEQALSKPGQVVEKSSEEAMQTEQVDPAELEDYRRNWLESREEVFKRGAHIFIKAYGARYVKLRPRFLQAYSELRRVESLLREVERQQGSGNLGRLFQIKTKVSPAVVKMRSILPLFENAFFRLTVLAEYHEMGYGEGMIDSSTSSTEFFGQFNNFSYEMRQRLSHTYYLLRLFQKLHGLTGGGPSFMDAPFGGGGMPESNMPEGFGGSPF